MAALLLGAVVVASPPTPTARKGSKPSRGILDGQASWYAYHEGQAAAGPALRKALGPKWRGMTVRVCAVRCVVVVLSDACQCYRGTARERLIDLDRRDFAKLAPPSRGLVRVSIR